MSDDDFDAELANAAVGLDNETLLDDIKTLIRKAESDRPRSKQRIPGPSGAGHPCKRHLAYLINRARSDTPEAEGENRFKDPLAAIIGTATHTWLEEAVRKDNKRLGRTRWIPEQRVVIRPQETELWGGPESTDSLKVVREELAGTCDLYDFDTKSVLDWKVPGATRLAEYTKYGPSEVYRGQAHLYGFGYKQLGFDVKTVGIVFIPRTGNMRGMHLWREQYDEDLVEEILSRLDHTEELMAHYNVTEHPTGFQRIPITPSKDCRLCPWFSPKPETAWQCGGQTEAKEWHKK